MVQEFCLGRQSLTDASLQTVMEQSTNYDKDPWKGPVGKDGKALVRGNPLANTTGADSGDPYKALGGKSLSIITLAVGRRLSRPKKGHAWDALARHAIPTTSPVTALS